MRLTEKEKIQYQEMLKMWDALELTEKNRKLAEQYMGIRQPENVELLKEVEYQNLRKDWMNENRWKCVDYLKYCRGKNKGEEAKRYIRFVIAVGGSTAYYVLVFHEYEYLNKSNIFLYLTREQWVALKAEDLAWNVSRLNDITNRMDETSPDILREAMKLCYGEEINAKLLIAGLSLYYTTPITIQENLSKEKQLLKEQIEETIEFMIHSFVVTIPQMVTEGEFSVEDIHKLKNFIEESEECLDFISISKILKDKKYNTYWITLFSSCIFLAIRHSKKFLNCLKLTMLMDAENKKEEQYTTLNSCLYIHNRKWFNEHISMLEEQLPIEIESYLIWCEKNEVGEAIKRISSKYSEKIKQVRDNMTVEEFLYLLHWVKVGNLGLYEELRSSFKEEYLIKIAYEIVGNWGIGCKVAQKYLLGEVQGDEIYPFVEKWRKNALITVNTEKKIISLKKSGNESIHQRAVVLMAVLLKKDFFVDYWIEEGKNILSDKEQFMSMVQILSQEKVPISYQIELLAEIYNYCKDNDVEKELFFNHCIEVFMSNKKEWEQEVITASKNGVIEVRLFCIQLLNALWEEYKGFLIDCVEDQGKTVQYLLIDICASHKDWENDMKELLYSQTVEEREVAIRVLVKWGAENYREELLKVLEKDKSMKLKKLIKHYLKISEDIV